MASDWPPHWQLVPLEDAMAAIIDYRGKTPRKTDRGVPLVTARIVKNGRIDTPTEFIDPDDYDEWMRRGLPEVGDVLVTTEAPLGEVAQLHDAKVALAQRLIALRGKQDVVDNTFLKFLMCSSFIQEQLRSRASGTTVVGIKQSELRRIELPLPPVSDQRKIAEILGSLDDKIELNRRMNRVLEEMARAIFKAWFIDFEPVKAKAAGAPRFPGMPQRVFDQLPNQLVDSELGEIPEGWEIGTVADLATFVNGKAFTKHANGRGRMIIRIAELNSGPGASTKYSDIDSAPDNTAFPGDILFAWSGSLGVHRWHRDEAMINQHIFKVIPEGYPHWFVYYQLVQAMPFFKTIASTKATTMGHIKRVHLSQATLAIPPSYLIEVAATQIRPLFDLIHVNERESLCLAHIRDTLLPKLISGELQVGGV